MSILTLRVGLLQEFRTLVASGAHELVISDHGELGPLDVQMSKKDELWEVQSGLTVMDTLTALQGNALDTFERIFLSIKAKSGGSITLKTATQIATEMTTGLFAPLYGQIDPLHIGEAGRAMSIAGLYGRRLLANGRNIRPEALDIIMSAFPSHGFVIDRQEADILFEDVRDPGVLEVLLAEKLGDRARWPDNFGIGERPMFEYLSTEPPATERERVDEHHEGDGHVEPGSAARPGPGEAAEAQSGESEGGNGDGHPVTAPDAPLEVRDGGREAA